MLHNGYKTTGFKNNIPIDVPNELQDKEYYFKYFTEECIDKERIYTLTARINNCLHSEFGIKNLYHRMIFTACALVAKRFQAPLIAGMDYETFKTFPDVPIINNIIKATGIGYNDIIFLPTNYAESVKE